jgi:hypothetical protein
MLPIPLQNLHPYVKHLMGLGFEYDIVIKALHQAKSPVNDAAVMLLVFVQKSKKPFLNKNCC